GTLSAFSEFSNNFWQHHTCDTSQSPRVQSTPSLGVDTCSTPPAVLNSAPVIEQSPSVAAASTAPHNVVEHSPSIAATSAAPHTVPPTPTPSPQASTYAPHSPAVLLAPPSETPTLGPSEEPILDLEPVVAAPASPDSPPASNSAPDFSGEFSVDLPLSPVPHAPALPTTNIHPM
ncbi:hypothetical protein FCV25MIE_01703, partial [Fagus crenata]